MIILPDDRGSLAYAVSGDGPPVVLLHAGVADHHMWDAVLPAFAAEHTVIRYDLRGFGASAPPTGEFRGVTDLGHLLDHLGHERVDLVGASWGGRISAEFTTAYPERVRSLALLAAPRPGYDWSATVREYGAAEEAALEAGDLDLAVRLNLDMWLRGPAREWTDVDPALQGQLSGPLRASLVHQAARDEWELAGPDIDLARIAVPTLVGIGRWDVPDFQKIARAYSAGIAGAQLVEFDAAHMIAMDAPEQLAAALTAFLRR